MNCYFAVGHGGWLSHFRKHFPLHLLLLSSQKPNAAVVAEVVLVVNCRAALGLSVAIVIAFFLASVACC